MEVAPDTAVVSLEVQSKGPTSKDSFSKNKKKVEAVKSAVKAKGIDLNNIDASTFSTYTDYVYEDYGKGEVGTITGFTASQSVRVKVKKEDFLADGIDKVMENGATRIDSIDALMFEINFAVDGEGENAKAARANVNAIVKKIKDALVGASMTTAKDFTVTYYSIYPKYDYSSSNNKKQFVTTHTVSITVHNLDLVDVITDAAVGAGAERVNSISFTLENAKAVQKKLRREAYEEAREKAEELAAIANVRAGAISAMSEVTPAGPFASDGFYLSSFGSSKPGKIRVEVGLLVEFVIEALVPKTITK